MKKLFLLLIIFVSANVFAQVENVVPARPKPDRLVNDFTNTLTPEQQEALERKLVAYDDSTSNQIAVVIISTTGDYPIEDVALYSVLRKWGVGNKKTNNGIVVLVAKDDRKVRIEVGYGLEGAIPDMTAASIVDHEMLPNFREGNYYRGLDEAATAIAKAAGGEYRAPEGYSDRNKKGSKAKLIVIIIAIILFILFSGAAGGRGGGGYVSRRGYRGWWLPTGGGWSGGGWSGGGGGFGGGGGGFGGFGGGSGGGGGASGSW
jgi:uncharacterized protein